MTITLTDGATAIDLSPDLYWSDENAWHPVEQTVQRTLTGALIVSAATRLKGRPITLQPQTDSEAWMTRATLDALRAMGDVAGKIMTLTLRGAQYSVIFRHHEGPAIDATPVVHFADITADDWYLVTLRFTEV